MQEIIRAVLLVVEGVTCLLLIGLILLQKSQGGGLGGAFGGGMGETLFGSRAGNVLTKGTIILSIIFMANTVVLAIMFTGGGREASLMQTMPGPVPSMPGAASAPETAPMQTAPAAAPVAVEDFSAPVEESAAPAE